MDSSPAGPPGRLSGTARALGLLILFLMLIAGVYGATMAARADELPH